MKTKIIQLMDDKHKTDLLSLYHDAWWACDRTFKDIDVILSNSSFYIGIIDIDNDKLIAFARVLTDHFQYSYIYDVIVDKSYRNLGLGKQLIEIIINHPTINGIKNIELVCRKEMMSFYSRFGFTDSYGKSISMRLQR